MCPLAKTQLLEEPDAGLVVSEGPCGEGLQAEAGAAPDGLFHQATAKALAAVVFPDVNPDLGGGVVGRSPVEELAQAQPADHLSSVFHHPDRTPRGLVLFEPRQPLLDRDGLGVGGHHPARDGGVVYLHDGRKVCGDGVAYFHEVAPFLWASTQSQVSLSSPVPTLVRGSA